MAIYPGQINMDYQYLADLAQQLHDLAQSPYTWRPDQMKMVNHLCWLLSLVMNFPGTMNFPHISNQDPVPDNLIEMFTQGVEELEQEIGQDELMRLEVEQLGESLDQIQVEKEALGQVLRQFSYPPDPEKLVPLHVRSFEGDESAAVEIETMVERIGAYHDANKQMALVQVREAWIMARLEYLTGVRVV